MSRVAHQPPTRPMPRQIGAQCFRHPRPRPDLSTPSPTNVPMSHIKPFESLQLPFNCQTGGSKTWTPSSACTAFPTANDFPPAPRSLVGAGFGVGTLKHKWLEGFWRSSARWMWLTTLILQSHQGIIYVYIYTYMCLFIYIYIFIYCYNRSFYSPPQGLNGTQVGSKWHTRKSAWVASWEGRRVRCNHGRCWPILGYACRSFCVCRPERKNRLTYSQVVDVWKISLHCHVDCWGRHWGTKRYCCVVSFPCRFLELWVALV